MALSKPEIEELYSRMPMLRPPPNIYVIRSNHDVVARTLHHNVHSANMAVRMAQYNYTIYGMHVPTTDFVFLAGNAGPETTTHEAVHFNGVGMEETTRLITRVLLARANMNMGIRRSAVHYEARPMAPEEQARLMALLHLSNHSGDPVVMEHLVYEP